MVHPRTLPISRTHLLVTLFVVTLFAHPVLASVMQSSNYQIESDSVNTGGGRGTSTSYTTESTAGEIATGYSSSTNYTLSAGYEQLLATSSISISHPADVTLSALGGIVGGQATSSSVWTVITDNTAGYSLTIKASTSPALIASGGAHFTDYVPASSDPDYTFTLGVLDKLFGFSVSGADRIQKYKDNGAVCNTGTGDTPGTCWSGLSTSDQSIAGSTSANNPSGTQTTVEYEAGIGSGVFQDSGTYEATITVTAIAL